MRQDEAVGRRRRRGLEVGLVHAVDDLDPARVVGGESGKAEVVGNDDDSIGRGRVIARSTRRCEAGELARLVGAVRVGRPLVPEVRDPRDTREAMEDEGGEMARVRRRGREDDIRTLSARGAIAPPRARTAPSLARRRAR